MNWKMTISTTKVISSMKSIISVSIYKMPIVAKAIHNTSHFAEIMHSISSTTTPITPIISMRPSKIIQICQTISNNRSNGARSWPMQIPTSYSITTNPSCESPSCDLFRKSTNLPCMRPIKKRAFRRACPSTIISVRKHRRQFIRAAPMSINKRRSLQIHRISSLLALPKRKNAPARKNSTTSTTRAAKVKRIKIILCRHFQSCIMNKSLKRDLNENRSIYMQRRLKKSSKNIRSMVMLSMFVLAPSSRDLNISPHPVQRLQKLKVSRKTS